MAREARKAIKEAAEEHPPIRYAVVGLGYISQAAVLPAFKNAKANSRLTALVSDDAAKLRALGRKYGVTQLYPYERYTECLGSGEIDAVFIGLPNSMHREYTTRAAEAGIHVLCEKPMATSSAECEEMIRVARERRVRLMIAYRLHFEPATLRAIETVQSDTIGSPRIFASTFTMQVKQDNIRLSRALGGGTLPDIGIYCINAARYLFRSEPQEVYCVASNSGDPRFSQVDETTSATLCFPGDRVAQFTCSFGTADTSQLTLIGTRGVLRMDPAYEHAAGLRCLVTVEGKTRTEKFPKVDQFAAELLHFSECVQTGREPRCGGEEGLADIRVIEALNQSMQTRQPVSVGAQQPPVRPTPQDEIRRPATGKAKLVHAESPTKS